MKQNHTFTSKQKHAITSLALTLGLRMFGVSLFLPVFTLYAKEFTSSGMLIGFAFGVYGLVQAILQIPIGMLSDRLGRKKIIILGLFVYLIGSIIAAQTHDIYLLIFARALQGAGAISGAVYAYIADVVEKEKRNRAMGFLGMPFGIAFGLGIILGPILGSLWGIPSLFWLCAILVGGAIVYVAVTLEEQPVHAPQAASFDVFVKDALSIISNVKLVQINLGGFITNFFMTGTFVVLPVLLQQHKDMKDFWQIIIPMVVLGTLIMLWSAKKGDAGKSKMLTQVAHLLLACSAIIYMTPYFHSLIIASVMFFAGFSMLQPLLSAGITTVANSDKVGGTSGLYNMSQFIGTFFGGFIGGMFVDNNIGVFLLILAALGLIGAIFVGRAFSTDRTNPEGPDDKQTNKDKIFGPNRINEALSATGTFNRTSADDGYLYSKKEFRK